MVVGWEPGCLTRHALYSALQARVGPLPSQLGPGPSLRHPPATSISLLWHPSTDRRYFRPAVMGCEEILWWLGQNYGGHTAVRLLAARPRLASCAIARSPVWDWDQHQGSPLQRLGGKVLKFLFLNRFLFVPGSDCIAACTAEVESGTGREASSLEGVAGLMANTSRLLVVAGTEDSLVTIRDTMHLVKVTLLFCQTSADHNIHLYLLCYFTRQELTDANIIFQQQVSSHWEKLPIK